MKKNVSTKLSSFILAFRKWQAGTLKVILKTVGAKGLESLRIYSLLIAKKEQKSVIYARTHNTLYGYQVSNKIKQHQLLYIRRMSI